MARLLVRRLWRERSVGMEGWVGAELPDGTLVALCSVEKWNLGLADSLREEWRGAEKKFVVLKAIHINVSEAELRQDGLGSGRLQMSGRPSW